MVCIRFVISLDAWKTKLKLPETCRLIKVIATHSVTLPKHKVSCYKWRKMAGVLLRETSLREALASHSIQTGVRDVCGHSDVGERVCVFFKLFLKGQK